MEVTALARVQCDSLGDGAAAQSRRRTHSPLIPGPALLGSAQLSETEGRHV